MCHCVTLQHGLMPKPTAGTTTTPYSEASKLSLPHILPPLSHLSQDFSPLALELSIDLTPHNLTVFVFADQPPSFSQNREGSKDHVRKTLHSHTALWSSPTALTSLSFMPAYIIFKPSSPSSWVDILGERDIHCRASSMTQSLLWLQTIAKI